jgi:hypothetical protein
MDVLLSATDGTDISYNDGQHCVEMAAEDGVLHLWRRLQAVGSLHAETEGNHMIAKSRVAHLTQGSEIRSDNRISVLDNLCGACYTCDDRSEHSGGCDIDRE